MQKSVWFSLVFLVLTLTGCGGGGGGGASTVTVSGLASKGPFVSGTVTIYDVSEGTGATQRKLLGSGGINTDNGSYEIKISPTTHPVMLEIAVPATNAPQYKDEANGGALKPLDVPLRALLPGVTGDMSVAVTPFTELAVVKAGSAPTIAGIEAANTLVSQLYQVPDIISTIPVDASATIPSGTDPDRINYSLALAAVSQLMKTQAATLATTLTTLSIQAGDTITSATAFKAAVSDFLSATTYPIKNNIPSIQASPFINVGTKVTTSIQADKQNALANGNDTVTVTASFSETIPDNTEITFTVSGSARFTGGVSSYTAKTAGGIATAALSSATPGDSVITATYVPGSTADVTVKFVATPTVTLQASKSAAQSSGTDTITLTATPSAVAAGYNTVTFAVTGAATFDNNLNSKAVNLNNGAATVAVKSTTAETVTVTATYAVSSTASVNVRFAQPASAVVEVGYTRPFTSVASFGFRVKSLPVGSISGTPAHALINISASLLDISGANTDTIFTVLYGRNSTLDPGFNISANVPVARLSYAIPPGQYPQFTVTLEDVNNTTLSPLSLIDPNNSTNTVPPSPAISISDYFINITYKDSSGNSL